MQGARSWKQTTLRRFAYSVLFPLLVTPFSGRDPGMTTMHVDTDVRWPPFLVSLPSQSLLSGCNPRLFSTPSVLLTFVDHGISHATEYPHECVCAYDFLFFLLLYCPHEFLFGADMS